MPAPPFLRRMMRLAVPLRMSTAVSQGCRVLATGTWGALGVFTAAWAAESPPAVGTPRPFSGLLAVALVFGGILIGFGIALGGARALRRHPTDYRRLHRLHDEAHALLTGFLTEHQKATESAQRDVIALSRSLRAEATRARAELEQLRKELEALLDRAAAQKRSHPPDDSSVSVSSTTPSPSPAPDHQFDATWAAIQQWTERLGAARQLIDKAPPPNEEPPSAAEISEPKQKRYQQARKLLEQRCPPEQIARQLGLSLSEIHLLRQTSKVQLEAHSPDETSSESSVAT